MLIDTAIADRLSDRIVSAVNTELEAMRTAETPMATVSVSLLAGQFFGLLAYLNTAPRPLPESVERVERAVLACLQELRHELPGWGTAKSNQLHSLKRKPDDA